MAHDSPHTNFFPHQNFPMYSIARWGNKWHIEFEFAKLSTLCISLKRDLKDHPSLIMDDIPIKEAEILAICVGILF